MNTDKDLLHKDITDKIIKAYYSVYNNLGFGFLEKVYSNAMCIELAELDLYCEIQKPIIVHYKKKVVGEYFADLVVNNIIIVEFKAAETLVEAHEIQLINYLRATDKEVGLLFNFGKKPEFKRKLFTNDRKGLSV
jgi:GxxExxY protein